MQTAKLKIVRKSATNEWLVKVWINGIYSEGRTYYTDCKADAQDTLTAIRQELQCLGYAILPALPAVRPETDCTIPLCDRMKGSK